MASTRATADLQLRETVRRLREADHLPPQEREGLAAAADRLADALASKDMSPAEAAQLDETASGLVEAVNQRHSASLLQAARERLERAIIAAETRAPLATGLARQLIDTLATLGI
jgi:hypothetical protein